MVTTGPARLTERVNILLTGQAHHTNLSLSNGPLHPRLDRLSIAPHRYAHTRTNRGAPAQPARTASAHVHPNNTPHEH